MMGNVETAEKMEEGGGGGNVGGGPSEPRIVGTDDVYPISSWPRLIRD